VSGVMLILLYALLVSGTRINGMRGWFTIDAGSSGTFFIQPSEFGKPIFILFLAKLAISGSHRTTISCKSYLKYLLFASLWFVPILLQPDYGTLLLYVTGFAMLYWLQGGQIVHLLVTIIAGIPLLAYVFYRHPYLQDRISGFLNPIAHAQDSGWHVLQLKNALASGGAWGRSFGNTLWSRNYLPLGHNDSIFATLAESIGFTGVAPIIFGVFVWFVYCIYVAKQQQFFHHALVVSGIAIMLAVQAFIHISITLGLFPPTGITLPMFSYGGSSLVSTMASIGVILSIAYKDTKNELQL
jgi:cell division protein FtsW (lipid II flippase)